jgi:hypothetical protein
VFQAYRRLTPHLRTAWEVEHILGKAEIYRAKQWFGRVKVERCFYLADLAAVPLRNTRMFEPMRKALESVDPVLLGLPGVRLLARMVVFTASHPKQRRAAAC